MTAGSLNALRRERELAALAGGERVDLLVVGGGVTGAGIAVDAAARGLSVALIEAYDLAYGTSRWSSKLVDAALKQSGLHAGPSTTSLLPLLGAAPRDRLSTVDAPGRLIANYGTEAPRIAAIGEVDPELGVPLFGGTEITAAEVVWAVRHEGALDVDDVLERRTRLGLVTPEAEAARPRVRELVEKSLAGLT